MLIKSSLTWRTSLSSQGTPSPVPQDRIPLSSMGFVGPLPLVTPASIVKRDGPCATSDITLWSEGSMAGTTDTASSLRESLDQGIPLPPLPRYPEWYLPRAPLTPSPTSSAMEPWETSTQMSSPPLCSSSPPKRGTGSSSKSRRPSPYARQTCVPRDPAQRLRMQAKSLLRRQVEESKDPFLVIAIWKSVLGQEQGIWDHDVLGCQECVCHPLTMKWSYCSSSCYHRHHPHHQCLSEDCCGLADWSN